MAVDTREFVNPSNIDIMNAIRNGATTTYQDRIPEATKANIDAVVNDLVSYQPTINEFTDMLVNLIGSQIVRNRSWSNPLGKFKRGMLQYGDTVEEIMVGLLKAKQYNPDRESLEKDIFGVEKAPTDVSYHKIDRQDYYKVSVNQTLLKRAFTRDGGLSSFIGQLMNAPLVSDQWDEFTCMASLFKTYDENNGFFKVHTADVAASSSSADDARGLLRGVRSFAGELPFITTKYNAAHMPVAANPDELELFLTPQAAAAIDVEALAAAFNIDRAQVPTRQTLIPAEHFGIDGAQAILTTRDFFVVMDTLLENQSAVNPVGLHTNYFLHHHQIISASRFVPAILFTTKEGDTITIPDYKVASVDSITVSDDQGAEQTNVSRGSLYQLTADVTTDPTGGNNRAVSWSVKGNNSTLTFLRQTGVLAIGLDESADSITVTATAEDNNAISLDKSIDIVGDLYEIWPNRGYLPDSDDDGLLEVTPAEPAFVDNVIAVPNVKGVQYKNGTTAVNNGSTITVEDGTPVTVNASARSGYELADGATASWTFTYSA